MGARLSGSLPSCSAEWLGIFWHEWAATGVTHVAVVDVAAVCPTIVHIIVALGHGLEVVQLPGCVAVCRGWWGIRSKTRRGMHERCCRCQGLLLWRQVWCLVGRRPVGCLWMARCVGRGLPYGGGVVPYGICICGGCCCGRCLCWWA
jgi:hypothetical protein